MSSITAGSVEMLSERQERLCTESRWDFSDLSALFLNCTLKRSPELSHTEGLIRLSQAILEKNGVGVELLRPVDYSIAAGVYPDMREHGWEHDDWPAILDKVLAADILVIGSSIWLRNRARAASQQPGSARTMAGGEMWYRVWRRSGRRWPAGRGAVR